MKPAALVVLAACSAPAKPVAPVDVRGLGTDQLLAASGDARALGAMLGAPLVLGGIWFPDPACRRTFSGAGEIQAKAREQFARCLATLHFARSERTSAIAEVAVVTYEPGLELEVQFAQQDPNAPAPFDRQTEIRWIGYVGRAGRTDALPTVTQRTLEAHRKPATSVADPARHDAALGDPALDDPVLAAEVARLAPAPVSTWVKLCVDATGAVSGVHPRLTTSIAAQEVFVRAASQWTFEPFTLGDQPAPVCALVRMGTDTAAPQLPVPLPDAAPAIVMPSKSRKRLGALVPVRPDDDGKRWIRDQRLSAVEAWLMYCVTPAGAVDRVTVIRPSYVPHWDDALATAVMQWHFEPLAVRTCSPTWFRYSRDGRVLPGA